MARVEHYRAELRRLTEWEPYLKKNSGLPGARANLELVDAARTPAARAGPATTKKPAGKTKTA